MKTFSTIIIATAMAVGFAAPAETIITVSDATIASYEFTSGSAASSDTETYTIMSTVTAPSIPGAAFTNDRLEVDANDMSSNVSVGSSVDDKRNNAISNNYYFSFTLTAASGTTVDLSSLVYDYVAYQPYEFYVGVYAEPSGFTNGDDLYERINTNNNSTTYTYNDETIDLSTNLLFQNLTGTTEFRFYLTEASTSSTRIFRFDNITLTGDVTTVIPEPSTALLAGLGLMGVCFRRRRR